MQNRLGDLGQLGTPVEFLARLFGKNREVDAADSDLFKRSIQFVSSVNWTPQKR